MFTHSKGRVETITELGENFGDKSTVPRPTTGMKRGRELGNIKHGWNEERLAWVKGGPIQKAMGTLIRSPLSTKNVGKAVSKQKSERGVTGAAPRAVVEMDGGNPTTGLDDWPVRTRKSDIPRKGEGQIVT